MQSILEGVPTPGRDAVVDGIDGDASDDGGDGSSASSFGGAGGVRPGLNDAVDGDDEHPAGPGPRLGLPPRPPASRALGRSSAPSGGFLLSADERSHALATSTMPRSYPQPYEMPPTAQLRLHKSSSATLMQRTSADSHRSGASAAGGGPDGGGAGSYSGGGGMPSGPMTQSAGTLCMHACTSCVHACQLTGSSRMQRAWPS